MALSNAAILVAHNWFLQETTAHADEFYDFGHYEYGEGAMYDHYFGPPEDEPTYDFWKDDDFSIPPPGSQQFMDEDGNIWLSDPESTTSFYPDYGENNSVQYSMDNIILSGVFIATSFLLDIFWIFLLRPET